MLGKPSHVLLQWPNASSVHCLGQPQGVAPAWRQPCSTWLPATWLATRSGEALPRHTCGVEHVDTQTGIKANYHVLCLLLVKSQTLQLSFCCRQLVACMPCLLSKRSCHCALLLVPNPRACHVAATACFEQLVFVLTWCLIVTQHQCMMTRMPGLPVRSMQRLVQLVFLPSCLPPMSPLALYKPTTLTTAAMNTTLVTPCQPATKAG